METVRLDVRLDEARRQKLKRIAAARGVPVSRVVRELIDRAYQEVEDEARHRAAAELCRLEVTDVPDPQALSRILDESHAIPDPY